MPRGLEHFGFGGAGKRQRPRPFAALSGLWLSWRDRLLANAQFQRWAAAFPLTRPIARARARSLFDLCSGFVYSQILLACVRVGLFQRLKDGPAAIEDIARSTNLTPEAAARLLQAAATLGLVEHRHGGKFGLGVHGAAVLGNPAVAAMVEHNAAFYADLIDPVALLRGELTETRLSKYWPYARGVGFPGAADVSGYTTLMAESQPLVAQDVLSAYSFDRHSCILDVGGGNGTFLRAVGERAPHLRLMLFDLPVVAELARQNLRSAGLDSRSAVFLGDFSSDALPAGADLITLVRVVHDHDDDVVRRLLRCVHAALPRGGRLLIAEPMADTRGAEAMGRAYFAFYLLAMGSGRARSADEIKRLVSDAGFSTAREIATHLPLQVRVIISERHD